MALPIQRCFLVFSLRQGTMLIGVVHLMLSSFGLFLLLLGSAHAQEMAAMLEADIEDSAQREGIVLSEDISQSEDGPRFDLPSFSQNEIRLHKARHLAIVVLVSLYTVIALTTVHLISCVLLLYGAVMRMRHLLLPWVGVMLLGLVFSCTAMLVSMFLTHGYRALAVFLVGSCLIAISFYLWLVAYSYYRQLSELERAMCRTEHHMLKNGYIQFSDKQFNV